MKINAIVWSLAGTGALALAGVAALPEASSESLESSATKYRIDPTHSSVLFRIKHGGATNFYGRFNRIDVSKSSFNFDPENPSAGSFEFAIDNASVDTGNEGRDRHLRNADFFNVAQFPTTTFKSTSIEAGDDDTFVLNGDLTLHGVTKPVTAKLLWLGDGEFNGPLAAFEAEFKFQRTDFGMTKYVAADGGESGALGNTVHILVSVEARPEG